MKNPFNPENMITYEDDGKGKWQSVEASFEYNVGTVALTAVEWGSTKAEARENLFKIIQPLTILLSRLEAMSNTRPIEELLKELEDRGYKDVIGQSREELDRFLKSDNRIPCMFDKVEGNKVMGLVCSCPKCVVTC